MIQLGLLGAQGRMGQWVSQLAESEFKSDLILARRVRRNEALVPLLECDVVIDFSTPASMGDLARLALETVAKNPSTVLPGFVVGSTGWNKAGLETLKLLASKTPVLVASNFSIGVLILREILKEYSPVLHKFGFTPLLTEAHHHHKKDSPSGTAITLQQAIRPEQPEAVQTHSIRVGEIIGDHEASFHGKAEKLTFSHSAQERSIFARGAIQAALWIQSLRSEKKVSKDILKMDDFFRSFRGV